MRLLGLVNPAAGRGRAARRLARLRDVSHDVDWVVTQDAADARARIGAARGVDGIVLLGGDGTVHTALEPIAVTGLPFGVVPAGRGNDFVRNLGLRRRDAEALVRRTHPSLRRCDLATVNGTPFASVACLGFDAAVNRLARDGAGLLGGTPGYLVCVLRALTTLRPLAVELTVDDWRWSGKVTLVAVANGACYGGGIRIAPDARLDDGLLDVCVVRPVSRTTLLCHLPRVFRGTHTHHPDVLMRRGASVRIETEYPEDVFADGEWSGRTPADWEVRREVLRVLVPGEGP